MVDPPIEMKAEVFGEYISRIPQSVMDTPLTNDRFVYLGIFTRESGPIHLHVAVGKRLDTAGDGRLGE